MEELKTPELELKQEYTNIFISDSLGFTGRNQIIITQKINNKYVFKQKGKRKEYYLILNKDRMLFKGQIPFIVDSETGHFSGNFMFNIIQNLPFSEDIKTFIEKNNLNPNTDYTRINLIIREEGQNQKEVLLYPEQALNCDSRRIREQAEKQLKPIQEGF